MSKRLQSGMKLVVASHNKGKVWEINQLIEPFGLDAVSAGELGLDEPEETEATFVGNARLKAEAAAKASGLPALADDSGLEVDMLDGAPGIYSARWAGPTKDFSIAMGKIADQVLVRDGWPIADGATGPKANFICVMCLAWPDGAWETFEGRVDGHLVWPARGGNGFGYDPMFVPEGGTKTFGEMDPDAKSAMSHRARAFAAFKVACLEGMEMTGVSETDVLEQHRSLEALTAAAANISTREELVAFVGNLAADLERNSGNWDNATLEHYLGAMKGWLSDADIADEPVWRTLAKFLLAARGERK